MTNRMIPRAQQKLPYAIVVVGGICFSFGCAIAHIWPGLGSLISTAIGFFTLTIISVASFIMGVRQWRVCFLSWMGPPVLSLGFVFLVPVDLWIGERIADAAWKFQFKNYASIVEQIQNGTLVTSPTLADVQINNLPSGILQVRASRQLDGSVTAVFLTGSGFPLHHSGYVFNSCGTNGDCLGQFNAFAGKVKLRLERNQWYFFSN